MNDRAMRRPSPHAARDSERRAEGEAGFRRISTKGKHPSQRFEYWRSLHPNIELEAVDARTRRDFRGELLHYSAGDGSTFGMAASDGAVARFATSHNEFVMFSLTLAGSAKFSRDNDAERVVSPDNGLVALDAARPFTSVSRTHEHVYLTVPRAKVVDAVGNMGVFMADGLLKLTASGIAELLKSHLLTSAKEGPRLDGNAAAAAVRCGVDLALETLIQELARNGPAGNERQTGRLHAAACRYIRLHFCESALTTARLADAVGCSRAHLCRVFAEKGERPGEVIRAARLEAARTLLTSATLPIEEVARSCGFDNPSAFARTFREFAGTTPSAYRQMHMLDAPPA